MANWGKNYGHTESLKEIHHTTQRLKRKFVALKCCTHLSNERATREPWAMVYQQTSALQRALSCAKASKTEWRQGSLLEKNIRETSWSSSTPYVIYGEYLRKTNRPVPLPLARFQECELDPFTSEKHSTWDAGIWELFETSEVRPRMCALLTTIKWILPVYLKSNQAISAIAQIASIVTKTKKPQVNIQQQQI